MLARRMIVINRVRVAAPMSEIMFMVFIQFFLAIFERAMAMMIPVIPPREFRIRSVISVAPMEKANCVVSYNRLVHMMGMNCFGIDFCSRRI